MRQHIHVYCPDGEAKFWIYPNIELAKNYGLAENQLNEIEKIIKDRKICNSLTFKKRFC